MDTTWYSTTKPSFVFNSSSYQVVIMPPANIYTTCNANDAVTRSVINTGICYDMTDQGLRRRRGFTLTGTWQ